MSTETNTPPAPTKGSPIHSLLAVVAGFVAMWILGGLYASVVYRLASAHFPEEGVPTTAGLALTLAGSIPNGIVAGLITGRVAGFAPVAHAAALGGIVGFFAIMSSGEARGMPWWFALGRIVLPTLFVLAGGAIARATAKAA